MVKNSEKIYRTSITIGTPLALGFQEDYDMLTFIANYEFNFARFLISINDEILKNTNPCNAVSMYKNRPSIIIVGGDYKVNIEMISENKEQMIKCTKYIEGYLNDYEIYQKKYIKSMLDFKFGDVMNRQLSSNNLLINLLENFATIKTKVEEEFKERQIDEINNDYNFSKSLEYALAFKILSILDEINKPSMSAIADNLININLLEIIELKTEINEKYSKNLLYPSIFLIVFFISLILLNFNAVLNVLRKVKLN